MTEGAKQKARQDPLTDAGRTVLPSISLSLSFITRVGHVLNATCIVVLTRPRVLSCSCLQLRQSKERRPPLSSAARERQERAKRQEGACLPLIREEERAKQGEERVSNAVRLTSCQHSKDRH